MQKLILVLLVIVFSCSTFEKKNEFRTVYPKKDIPRSQLEVASKGSVVASQGVESSRIGRDIFSRGGNIIDAAVAMSFAISVERPQSTGLGGGGFLLFYEHAKKKTWVIDFREMAPERSHNKMFLKENGEPDSNLSLDGGLAVGVPGLVAGLHEIHQKFGKLSWAEVIAPSIELAEKGFTVDIHFLTSLKEREAILLKNAEAKAVFFNKDGSSPRIRDLIKQSQLASTLRKIQKKGRAGFYSGEIAERIVESVKKNGGIMGFKDLSSYQVKWREPVEGSYHGYKIHSMPPPSSGGTHVIEILQLLEPQNLSQWGVQHPETIHRLATAMQISFADRAKFMGDPDFAKIPVNDLTSKEYAKLRQSLFSEKAYSSSFLPGVTPWIESSDTTHFTLADKDLNMVTTTQTINGLFGSGVMAEGTGIILNNQMDDFAAKVGASNLFGAIGGDKNLVAPKKRPLSSMSPTIIFKDDMPILALGTPSGTRIISCVAQTLINVLEFNLPLYDAVAATRIHHQWQPEELRVEKPFFISETMKELKKKGHKVDRQKLGCKIQAIGRLGDQWIGVSDPRGQGAALEFTAQ